LTYALTSSTLSLVSNAEKIVIVFLRASLGWMFLYSGIIKIFNPVWSAEGFLKSAQTFPNLYHIFASPSLLPSVNFVNEWGQLLLGISLIAGIGVRVSSMLGAVLMLLYYFPPLNFPYVGKTSYLVDQHIIYALLLVYFSVIRAGRIYGLENWCASLPLCKKVPRLRSWFG